MPRISLVICAHNEEKYIGNCLEHALRSEAWGKAKYKRDGFVEILVIDNASTDHTKEIAESYPSVRVVHEAKKGLTRARQCGYLNAKGDVLAFIDADTQMPEWWYNAVYEEFSKDPTLGCLSGPYVYYDMPEWKKVLVKLYYYTLAYPAYLVIGYMATGGNFAIKKSVLKKMEGFDVNIEFYGEDTNIARRASQYAQVKFKNELFMYTSARRLAGQNMFKTSSLYVFNFLSEVVLHRPVTKRYHDLR